MQNSNSQEVALTKGSCSQKKTWVTQHGIMRPSHLTKDPFHSNTGTTCPAQFAKLSMSGVGSASNPDHHLVIAQRLKTLTKFFQSLNFTQAIALLHR